MFNYYKYNHEYKDIKRFYFLIIYKSDRFEIVPFFFFHFFFLHYLCHSYSKSINELENGNYRKNYCRFAFGNR